MAIEVLSEKILTLREASNYLSIHPNTMRRLIKKNYIKAYRLTDTPYGNYRIKLSDIQEYLNRKIN